MQNASGAAIANARVRCSSLISSAMIANRTTTIGAWPIRSSLPNSKVAEMNMAARTIADARRTHEELIAEAQRDIRMLDEQRKAPFRIRPFFYRSPHQRDGRGVTHHIERAQAEQVALQSRER